MPRQALEQLEGTYRYKHAQEAVNEATHEAVAKATCGTASAVTSCVGHHSSPAPTSTSLGWAHCLAPSASGLTVLAAHAQSPVVTKAAVVSASETASGQRSSETQRLAQNS
eukprot:scaffold1163_cov362-Prasinococcus_capsulatus_cf.AAC.19